MDFIPAAQHSFANEEDENRFHVYSGSEKLPGGLVDKEYRILGNHLLLVDKSKLGPDQFFLQMFVVHSPLLGLKRYVNGPSPFAWVEPDGELIPFAATNTFAPLSIWGPSQPQESEDHEPDDEELALWNLGGFPLNVSETVALDILADDPSQFERARRRAEVYWRNHSAADNDPADWWKQ